MSLHVSGYSQYIDAVTFLGGQELQQDHKFPGACMKSVNYQVQGIRVRLAFKLQRYSDSMVCIAVMSPETDSCMETNICFLLIMTSDKILG